MNHCKSSLCFVYEKRPVNIIKKSFISIKIYNTHAQSRDCCHQCPSRLYPILIDKLQYLPLPWNVKLFLQSKFHIHFACTILIYNFSEKQICAGDATGIILVAFWCNTCHLLQLESRNLKYLAAFTVIVVQHTSILLQPTLKSIPAPVEKGVVAICCNSQRSARSISDVRINS